MSKTLKRALMGGALGALQGAQQFFQTQRAQEAERLKEERLAAIRASERAEDRAFQTEQTNRTLMAQAERDDRLNAAQLARDERQAEIQAERDKRAAATQLAVANTYRQTPESAPTRFLVNSGGREFVATEKDLADLPEGAVVTAGLTAAGGIVKLGDDRGRTASVSGAPPKAGTAPAEAGAGGAGKPDVVPGGVMADESVDDGILDFEGGKFFKTINGARVEVDQFGNPVQSRAR